VKEINLGKAASELGFELVGYEVANKIPRELFSHPDHIAIQAANIKEFQELVQKVTRVSEEAYCIENEPRFLVAAKLMGKISMRFYGDVRWLEIEEPQKGAIPMIGLEHVEFLFSDVRKAKYELQRRNIEHEPEIDENHGQITMPLKSGQEIRVTDRPISSIAYERLEKGQAYDLLAA
jgi:hypothetical protein